MTVPSWEDMSADQRQAKRLADWRNAELDFDSAEAEATYRARVDRLITPPSRSSRSRTRVPQRGFLAHAAGRDDAI